MRLYLAFRRSGDVLIHGAAPGADRLAAEIWQPQGGTIEAYPADWKAHGKGAGPIRNQRMLDAKPDIVIAFPGGSGTADMVRRARSKGLKVRVIP
jgi:hypothetical protein